ncbi:cytochrome c biogenesis heme-transporting ATPase CcmA [Limnobaculum zhutongyuii]|uniref:Cytochrome c biogenesis heme-transporting ATPase CcmA n=1 Tax=Limnobaculum zhutongyuii TaxID=2498113 RepID=A0A411WRY5_9GAMM|nr:cytochrome c biogenesis heme-transporting ATPase CcmA [Limnobaculum zhutongyuii]QBH98765.1 cytochrome c biogenesis heme-transporting ATPase CcmA [Limnobaculum zhutongyuii]TQS87520.1 cytochrome c biogenesis heme-transporting ATPase CcmA [Limnobaculum zhutongyuii]
MLEAQGLNCIRDERALFTGLSFAIHPGELVQIEGPNGAGKTSLLRILAGLASSDGGDILWQGESTRRNRDRYNHSLLYIGHQAGVKAVLTPFENLSFFQKSSGKKDPDAIWSALSQVGLVGYEDVPVAQLSAGQHRRVALARLWLSDAPLWILDEPLTAIDKQGVEHLTRLFEQHAEKVGIVILTTHQDMMSTRCPIRKIKLDGGVWR